MPTGTPREEKRPSQVKKLERLAYACVKHNVLCPKEFIMDALDWSEAFYRKYATPEVLDELGIRNLMVSVNAANEGKKAKNYLPHVEGKKLAFVSNVQTAMNKIVTANQMEPVTIVDKIAEQALMGDKNVLMWLGDQAVGRPSSEVKVLMENAQLLSVTAGVLEKALGADNAKAIMFQIRDVVETMTGKGDKEE